MRTEISYLDPKDNYIIIPGYIPNNINNKNTFVYDHDDECMRKNVDNFIWSNHVFGSFVNCFNSDEEFTLIPMPKCTTYIKKKTLKNTDNHDIKAAEILGIKKRLKKNF